MKDYNKWKKLKPLLQLKDYKDGFPHTLSFSPIIPSKSNIGKISKSILQSFTKYLAQSKEIQ